MVFEKTSSIGLNIWRETDEGQGTIELNKSKGWVCCWPRLKVEAKIKTH